MKVRLLHVLIICFALQHCAKQTAPTGGPKDEIPPVLIKSDPKHEEVNVKSSKLELTFNEDIQLNNPREQLIITPSVGKIFETSYKKNKVVLDLKSDLKENTTYSISFREGIQDLTEKNAASVKLAFSTGSYIDSLSINGKVFDALTEKVAVNYTVALVEVSDTFNIFKHPASWITLTDKRGFFSLENLKPGNYLLYAFDDRSKNLIVDPKTEKYGFQAENVQLEKNLDSLRLKTFKLDVSELKLISARTTFAYFNLRFSKSLTDYSVTSSDSTRKIYSTLEPDLTTLKVFNTIPDLDSLQINVQATDSLNSIVDTLLYLKFPKKDATKDKFTAKVDKTSILESNATLTSEVSFTKPITKFIPDSMFIELDSITKIPFTKEEYSWNNRMTKLSLAKRIDINLLFPKDTTSNQPAKSASELKKNLNSKSTKQKKESSLTFRKGTFISVENDTTPTFSTPLILTKSESSAILETKVMTDENFIIQILNKSGVIIQQRINQKESSFENLPPDTYTIRVIIDINKNDKWDPGSFTSRTEPEPVIYYRNPKNIKEIPLKANWTVGPLLITY